jgi:hypothetical protein
MVNISSLTLYFFAPQGKPCLGPSPSVGGLGCCRLRGVCGLGVVPGQSSGTRRPVATIVVARSQTLAAPLPSCQPVARKPNSGSIASLGVDAGGLRTDWPIAAQVSPSRLFLCSMVLPNEVAWRAGRTPPTISKRAATQSVVAWEKLVGPKAVAFSAVRRSMLVPLHGATLGPGRRRSSDVRRSGPPSIKCVLVS